MSITTDPHFSYPMAAILLLPIAIFCMLFAVVHSIGRAKLLARARNAERAHDESSHPALNDQPAVLDLSLLREVFPEDGAKVQQLLHRFLTIADGLLREIDGFADQRDAQALADTSHKLKSSALTSGAYALADVCRVLEDAGQSEDWQAILTAHSRLRSELDRLRALLDNVS